jgi:hypothetical protein
MVQNYPELAQTLIFDKTMSSLEKGLITESDLPIIAKFVLKHTKSIKTHDNFIGFLQLIAIKWPIYHNLAKAEEGKIKTQMDAHLAKNMLRLIHKGQVQQAIDLAKQYK